MVLAKRESVKMSNKKRVIFDTDPGTDDAFALLLLLHAEKLQLVKIEAIVCSNGNSSLENTTKNLVRLLEIFDRTDIPVYKGAVEALIPSEPFVPPYHGEDGFGDLEHEKEPNLSIVQKEPGATATRNLVIDNPGEITLVCVGPLTNVALAMKVYDDFAPNIKEIFILGGNYAAVGNSRGSAEFNFYIDPESAQIVLNKAKCPITIAPWEASLNTQITFDWRFNVLGLNQSPFMELLNRAERKVHSEQPLDAFWISSDAFLVMTMLYPEEAITHHSKWNTTVELHGTETRGQLVLDHYKTSKPNVTIIKSINNEFAKYILQKAAEEIL